MASELQQTIDRVNAKTQILFDRYALLKQKREEAVARIAELEKEIAKLQAENQQLHTEVEFLKTACIITPNRGDVERSRALLSGLVREIDKCITELNE